MTPASPQATDPRTSIPAPSATRRAFTAYARWLDSISWRRFLVLSVLLLIACELVSELPPFNIPWGSDRIETRARAAGDGSAPAEAIIQIKDVKGRDGRQYEIRIDGTGVQVKALPPAASASGATAESSAPNAPPAGTAGPSSSEIADAVSEAREALEESGVMGKKVRVRAFRLGDTLPQLALVVIVVSIVIKIMAAGRFRAEAQAEVANEKAESESLKRQVVEARLSAMQAQVEPHFLFNTLASIDHLIETDPPRASQMQKNLIALLRASMPSLREAASAGPRELARELEVIRPYLEILKMRMDDRLQAEIDVPPGLLSAEFPPMMIQGLVENAIKHGLEPKPEGGRLTVSAFIAHGRLVVRVADTGLGFGRSGTTGTGVGLANIRERLALLYGDRASLNIAPNPEGGTIVTVTLPYRSLQTEPLR